MSAIHQWKVVDERDSGNICAFDHWYSTHNSRIVRVRTTQTTQKLRKAAQNCVNSYAKPSFELLKTWNRVKRRSGVHRRTSTDAPHKKNWWNAQIADVSRKTRILCVIHAFTRILASVTRPLRSRNLTRDLRSLVRFRLLKTSHPVCIAKKRGPGYLDRYSDKWLSDTTDTLFGASIKIANKYA